MKHKYIILSLTVILAILIAIKVSHPHGVSVTRYDYPIHFGTVIEDFNKNPKVWQAIKDKGDNKVVNPLFFCYGNTKLFDEPKKYPDYAVYFEGTDHPATIEYDYYSRNSSRRVLQRVDVRIRRADYSGAKEQLIANLGSQYIDWGSEESSSYSILWFFPYCYVYYKHSHLLDDIDYITVATYEREGKDFEQIYKHGVCNESTFFKSPSSSKSNSSSSGKTKTYKYGDSDTYQGSSKQKEDLKAIDDYFGF